MRSADWRGMDTAPLNPYGAELGPKVLIWCDADNNPWPAMYSPRYDWIHCDPGPAWIIADGEEPPIHPENAIAWMPIAAPWCVLDKAAGE